MRSGTTCPHLPFFCLSKGLDEVGHRVQPNGSSPASQKAQYDPGPRGFVTSLRSELPCPDIMLKNHCSSLGLADIAQLVGARSNDFPREGRHSPSRILETCGGILGCHHGIQWQKAGMLGGLQGPGENNENLSCIQTRLGCSSRPVGRNRPLACF